MRGTLVNVKTGESFDLEDDSSIGRSRDSVVVIADPRVSRRHALIRRQEDGFWLFDLGSINGSYLNGKRITTATLLKEGDQVRIGEHVFNFKGTGLGEGALNATAADVTIVDVQAKEAILLVSDIQGFTALSERLPPDQLAPIIGSWYASTETILDAHEANIDKFIGDCVLAYWLDTSPEFRLSALKAALEMQKACNDVQSEHSDTLAKAGLDFRSGAALHLGSTAYGAFSASEFTLLGDSVNLVFRLEGLTREMDERVVLSGEMLEGWEEGKALCQPLGSHKVKGRSKAVELFTPVQRPE